MERPELEFVVARAQHASDLSGPDDKIACHRFGIAERVDAGQLCVAAPVAEPVDAGSAAADSTAVEEADRRILVGGFVGA